MYIIFERLFLEMSRYHHLVPIGVGNPKGCFWAEFNKFVGAVFILKNQNYLSGVFWPKRKLDFQKCFSCICNETSLAVILIANLVEIDGVVFSPALHTTDN